MNKTLIALTVATLPSVLMADVDPQTRRWLIQNPSSAQRADVLLNAEHDQMAANGSYDLSPVQAPRLHQLRPSQEHLQYFYDNQNALRQLHEAQSDASVIPSMSYAQLRQRYQQLYDLNDPSFRSEAEYYLGYIDYAEGKYDNALHHFNALPNDDKYLASATFYRMQIHYAKGEWNEAENDAKAFTAHPKGSMDDGIDYTRLTAEALRIQAECQLHNGKTDEALVTYRQYMNECDAPVAASAYNAGVLEFYEENYQAAASAAGIAAQTATHPQLVQFAYMLAGQAALQMGETQQALLDFQHASQITEGEDATREAAAYNVCALTHTANYSIWGDEVTLLESFLNTYPTSRYADRVSEYLAEVYTTTRNYEAALQSISKVRQPSASLLKAKQRLHYQLGVQKYLNNSMSDAERQFSEAIRLGQRDAVALAESHFWRGEARYHQSQWSLAAADYQQFVRLNPKGAQPDLYAASFYNLGYAQMQTQDYQSAITSFASYIAQPGERGTESYVDGLLRLADCYYYTRQFPSAESYYHTAAVLSSRQQDYAIYQEAFMMGLQKKYAQKQAQLDRLIAQCPSSSLIDDAWLDKGRTSLLQNDAPSAIHSFQQVIDLYADSPIAPQAAVELAMTYNNLGQTAAAQRIYQLVAERYPNTDAAQTAAEDMHVLGIQQQLRSLPGLYESGQYQALLDTYQSLTAENIDFREAQNLQLLAAKAHLQLGQRQQAEELLVKASSELRTAAGSEAKYLLAQSAFDSNKLESATNLATELIQSGTPHQYWLARAIILMSDILRRQDDSFTADEYLKSLQQNYAGTDDDIPTLINQRLE
ncbi:MAG: tetratricopeptide repeat protein [Bacteroidales bacterium]|nr:tetratricopeptide repeat protein [Candidatus Liminaster caballi]